jgi:hypothetical protein
MIRPDLNEPSSSSAVFKMSLLLFPRLWSLGDQSICLDSAMVVGRVDRRTFFACAPNKIQAFLAPES